MFSVSPTIIFVIEAGEKWCSVNATRNLAGQKRKLAGPRPLSGMG